MTAIAVGAPRRLPRIIPASIVVAWVVSVAAEVSGYGALVHHGTLIEKDHLPIAAALAIFLLAWQLMFAAMMLPTALPMIRGFLTVAADQPRRVVAAFFGAYALVWTGFGAVAFVGDIGVHRSVDAWPWLDHHPWLISGATLAIAGAFQFSALKDRCLTECEHPGTFLLRYYRRGTRAAARLGLRHGLFCVGCCWALMLVMFGAGVANLWWMAALTGLMVVEKTTRVGPRMVPIAGATLLGIAALAVIHPYWLPPVFGSST